MTNCRLLFFRLARASSPLTGTKKSNSNKQLGGADSLREPAAACKAASQGEEQPVRSTSKVKWSLGGTYRSSKR